MQSVTLEDPCSLRVAAAWVWTVVKARDMMQFEKVLELLDVFHTLLPQLVTPIKHMKVMFGLKTVV
uniref:TERF1-interacting nuclear factor 2 N-terminal domain-containing protein n=1 Tax=Paramormyrops kingsleyae TaxID=1676925 RepID=A0A3B3QAT3_9TELE